MPHILSVGIFFLTITLPQHIVYVPAKDIDIITIVQFCIQSLLNFHIFVYVFRLINPPFNPNNACT